MKYPASKHLGQLSLFHNGEPSSSGFDDRPLGVDVSVVKQMEQMRIMARN
jgi:hypothetical protein